jgi:hypothetical protein
MATPNKPRDRAGSRPDASPTHRPSDAGEAPGGQEAESDKQKPLDVRNPDPDRADKPPPEGFGMN